MITFISFDIKINSETNLLSQISITVNKKQTVYCFAIEQKQQQQMM